MRSSTSAGLYRADTGERLPGSDGEHIFVAAMDGSDNVRCLKVLHERCWLAGFGWFIVGEAGQLLDRSIVDRMVGGPERLVFEGPPILQAPLQQEPRRALFFDGEALDTAAAFPPLTMAKRARTKELKAKAAYRLAAESAQGRDEFISNRAAHLAERAGITEKAARQTIARQCAGILHPDLELPFDDPELAGCTVAEVLADLQRLVEATLADPLEGIAYGRDKAMIMRRADGSLWIHSFAHGRTIYELKYNARAIEALLKAAEASEVAKLFIELALRADLDAGASPSRRPDRDA